MRVVSLVDRVYPDAARAELATFLRALGTDAEDAYLVALADSLEWQSSAATQPFACGTN